MAEVQTPSTSAHETSKQRPAITPRHIVQAEANLLRFPFFALHTKGLGNRRAIEVLGTRKDQEGTRHDFSLRISRNTDYSYPGPLSRKLHFALLSILFEQGQHPFENPITWDWRDLNRRTGDTWSGNRTTENYKDAIASTHGVVITTNYALMRKHDDGKQPLPRRTKGYHLYERYEFIGELGDDGGVADVNRLWLADWYLANLNALYSGPLKYDLWVEINDHSVIASRLYEFLLYHSSVPTLRINYPYLASFLPVTPRLHISRAKEQLTPAFDFLRYHDVLADYQWSKSRDGQIQLVLRPGPNLERHYGGTSNVETIDSLDDFGELRVIEVSNTETPEQELVRRYHDLRFGNANHRPTKPELSFAQELFQEYPSETVFATLPKIAKLMEEKFQNGITFGAARPYFPNLLDTVIKTEKRQQHRTHDEEQRLLDEAKANAVKQARVARQEELLRQWQTLTSQQQRQLADQAIQKATSQFIKNRLQKASAADHTKPPAEFLAELD